MDKACDHRGARRGNMRATGNPRSAGTATSHRLQGRCSGYRDAAAATSGYPNINGCAASCPTLSPRPSKCWPLTMFSPFSLVRLYFRIGPAHLAPHRGYQLECRQVSIHLLDWLLVWFVNSIVWDGNIVNWTPVILDYSTSRSRPRLHDRAVSATDASAKV